MARPVRTRRAPSWAGDFNIDFWGAELAEDEWPVRKLLETRRVGKRRQYLVEWDGDWESTWEDEKNVSKDLKTGFEEGVAMATEVRGAMEFMLDSLEKLDGGEEKKKDDHVAAGGSEQSGATGKEQVTVKEKDADGVTYWTITIKPLTAVRSTPFSFNSLSVLVKYQLTCLFSMFYNALSISKKTTSEVEYMRSFTVPFSAETFESCFLKPFTSSPLVLDTDPLVRYRLSLSVKQLDYILGHISAEQGCPWYQRDGTTSDSSKVYGDINLTWRTPEGFFYSHEDCVRCSASREQLLSGSLPGVDVCNPKKVPFSLPHELRVSFWKKTVKSLHWKGTEQITL